ncbi:MAG: TatD family hydrolase [Lachnospiraceae bacterium]|nr:TatD family hydrolase [Lachnospiraceae bacterium]
MIFDTHAHYDDEQFDTDREALLASLSSHGVGTVVDVGASAASLPLVRQLAHTYEFVYGAVGLHPDEVGDLTDEVMQDLERDMADPKIVAVGEIGLDYYWDKESHDTQELAFRRQIELALAHGKPIIVHSRSAAEDTLRVISEYYGKTAVDRPGIIHCYSYSAAMAEQYVAMGFVLGVGGVVTYKNGKKLKQTVERIPLKSLVLETDCPYLSPEPYRGKRNSSIHLTEVAKAIAEIKGVDPQTVIDVTEANARRVFRLDDETFGK